MTVFEIIIISLITFYVVSSFVFELTGRILNRKLQKTEESYEAQITMFSKKICEFQESNADLQKEVKRWVNEYDKIVFAYNAMEAKNKKLKDELKVYQKEDQRAI